MSNDTRSVPGLKTRTLHIRTGLTETTDLPGHAGNYHSKPHIAPTISSKPLQQCSE